MQNARNQAKRPQRGPLALYHLEAAQSKNKRGGGVGQGSGPE